MMPKILPTTLFQPLGTMPPWDIILMSEGAAVDTGIGSFICKNLAICPLHLEFSEFFQFVCMGM